MTKEEAIKFHKSGKWKNMTQEELFKMQINEKFLCIPFGIFHEATEIALGRPVFTHEFANPERLYSEYLTSPARQPFSC